jgi:hypothetical protein
MSLNRVAYLTLPLLALCALVFFPVTWKPWVSPRYAAQYLVGDDGKGFAFWIPAAAKRWGSRIFEPLADETQNFDLLAKEVETRTVLEIITTDGPAVPPDVVTKLLGSKSVPAGLLGMYALSVRGQSVVTGGVNLVNPVSLLAREMAREPMDADDISLRLALSVVAQAKLPGAIPALQSYLEKSLRPYWTIVAACRTLEAVPERNEAIAVLGAAVRNPEFFPRLECAGSLARIAGGAATSSLEEGVRVERDEQKRSRLKQIIEGLG